MITLHQYNQNKQAALKLAAKKLQGLNYQEQKQLAKKIGISYISLYHYSRGDGSSYEKALSIIENI